MTKHSEKHTYITGTLAENLDMIASARRRADKAATASVGLLPVQSGHSIFQLRGESVSEEAEWSIQGE
jgi:hypothetical protein